LKFRQIALQMVTFIEGVIGAITALPEPIVT
jgi:hypothetical protein